MQGKLLTLSTAILLALSASAGTAATFTEENSMLDSTKSDTGKPADSLEKSERLEAPWNANDADSLANADDDYAGAEDSYDVDEPETSLDIDESWHDAE